MLPFACGFFVAGALFAATAALSRPRDSRGADPGPCPRVAAVTAKLRAQAWADAAMHAGELARIDARLTGDEPGHPFAPYLRTAAASAVRAVVVELAVRRQEVVS